MKNLNVNGVVILFIAGIIGKVFGAIYRIPLSNLLGAEGMGLYQMAFPIYSFLLTIITGGISITLSKKIAKSRASNNILRISKDYILAKNTSKLLGGIFFFILIAFAYPLAYFQGNSSAIFGYFAIAIGFVFACVLGAYRGYYQGFGNMFPTALSQLLEQICKLIFGIVFSSILIKFGVIHGVFGALLGISFSEIVCLVYFLIINKKNKLKHIKLSTYEYKQFCKDVIPVGLTYGIMPLASLIDSFLVVNLLTFSGFLTVYSTSLYGIETGMILPLINMPNVLISAIAIYSVPDIAYSLTKGEGANKVSKIFKTTLIFILPCCVGLFILALPVLSIIYPNLTIMELQIATNLLKFSIFEMFFLCFVTISNAVLQAFSKVRVPILSLTVGMFIKVLLTIILVVNSNINIYGLVIASCFGYFVTAMINVIKIKKICGFSLKLAEILAPIISCALMLVTLICLLSMFNSLNVISVMLIILASALVYFAGLLMLKQISIKEIKNLLQKEAK